MTTTNVRATLDPDYSDPGATPTDWSEATRALTAAELSWISTVRPDGRPHVTPLMTVVRSEVVYFCTGPEERKGRNLAANPEVVLTTGVNVATDGLDIVVEGAAERITDTMLLADLAEAWVEKYGEGWRFGVSEDGFRHAEGNGLAWVFGVRPRAVFGFGKAPYSQTRWTFDG